MIIRKCIPVILFSVSFSAYSIDCNIKNVESNFTCDLEYLKLTLASINFSKSELSSHYGDKQFPSAKKLTELKSEVELLASVINKYNQCIRSFSDDHICGKDGYDQLSLLWDYNSTLPKSTNAEIIAYNKQVNKYSDLAAKYKSCPRVENCNLPIQMYTEKTDYTVSELAHKNLLSYKSNKCSVEIPKTEYLYVKSLKTKDMLYSNLKGMIGLRTYLTCGIEGQPYKTERKINITPKSRSTKSLSFLTVVDDWKSDNDIGSAGIVRLPIGQQMRFDDEAVFTPKESGVKVSWGTGASKAYLLLSHNGGEILKTNIFDNSAYSKSSCSTITKKHGSVKKLYPNLKLSPGIKSSDIRG